MEEQDGKPFDPANCLLRDVANVICGNTFKEGYNTTNPDLRYQGTPNDNITLSPFERQAFHKNLTNYVISESLMIEDYENVFR